MNTLDKQKIKTAINIQIGDDGSKAKKILEILEELEKMTLKEYREQQKYFGVNVYMEPFKIKGAQAAGAQDKIL